jgi:hypothetical protein
LPPGVEEHGDVLDVLDVVCAARPHSIMVSFNSSRPFQTQWLYRP